MNQYLPVEPNTGVDCIPAVRAALADPSCRRLVFRPGRYDFYAERADEHYLFISNNDEGLKRVAFPLFDRDGMEIDGGGAQFFFHGGIIPIAVEGGRNVFLKNFSIDYDVPFHGEAEVLHADSEGVDVRIQEGFPYEVVHGALRFGTGSSAGAGAMPFAIRNILEFDAARRETAFLVWDNHGIGQRLTAEVTGPRQVRLHAAFKHPLPTLGNILAIMSERRDFPGVAISGCNGVGIEDVIIHHAGGMGIIAQRTSNITLRRVQVTPPAGGARMISTVADATHFVNCRGRVEILDCLFENQMDDPTNIHGIYAQVSACPAPGTLEVRLRHHQQYGVTLAGVGDRVELVDGQTMATYHEATVTSVQRLNKEFTLLELDTPPERAVQPGDAVANLTWTADAHIRGCTCRGNRARGFLLSTAGRIVVEENTMHSPGAAILIEGDANHWFESGATRDILIRRNRFVDCKYGVWGRATIQVTPGIPEGQRAGSRYHRNIRVEDNTFIALDARLVYAHCVDGLSITGNRITPSRNYPLQHQEAPPFDTPDCLNVHIEGNEFSPAP